VARLPVSGARFELRGRDGNSEMLAAETSRGDLAAACVLLEGTATLDDNMASSSLCITDFEYLLLCLRARWYGSSMALGLACPHCGDAAEMQFQIDDMLALARPRMPSGVAPADREGWYRLGDAMFRLPVISDMLEAAPTPSPARALAVACMDNAGPALRRRIERAMEAMAPEVSRMIAGTCPACANTVETRFSAVAVVIAEMKRNARDLHDDVDVIARAYHWPQAEILSLPQERRRAYVERIRRAEAA
jgi:hypothetical protein